jgi:hypothetical protein
MLQGFLSCCMLPFHFFGYFRSYAWLLEATSWLLPYDILWVAQLIVTPFFVFYPWTWTEGPGLCWFQYMKLAFNPRSILLNPCINDLSLTQYGLPFKLVVAVVIEFLVTKDFPSTSYEKCSLMESNGSRQESLSEPRSYVRDSATPSVSAMVYVRC